LDKPRHALREGILATLRSAGLDLQQFGLSGLPKGDNWSFQRASAVLDQCDGAVVIGLARWIASERDEVILLPTEYSHFEGALAVAKELPVLAIAEDRMLMRGIFARGGDSLAVWVSMERYASWLKKRALEKSPPFLSWIAKVKQRKDVFLGYCSKSNATAMGIKQLLTAKGFSVMDWATDFRPGRTIMEEVSRAAAMCRCGLFLFTADDPLEGSSKPTAVPRDNVLLEAGYFCSFRGTNRVLIVRETDAKMPADLGGIIYISINTPKQWKAVANEIVDAVRHMVFADTA
jgi:hypothetical protein